MSDFRCYIHTIGCQMNVYDSEQILARLSALGYRQVDNPETADLVYHTLVLLAARDLSWADVEASLAHRFGK